MSQQQDDHYDTKKIKEEYIASKRAAVEAISSSRSVIETTLMQGEQIQNMSNLHDQQEYMVKRADRLVRGMTWKGWLLNKFSHPPTPPSFHLVNSNKDDGSRDGDKDFLEFSKELAQYIENIPDDLQGIYFLISNYAGNVKLLQECRIKTEYMVLSDTCHQLKNQARESLNNPRRDASNKIVEQLLKYLHQVESFHTKYSIKLDQVWNNNIYHDCKQERSALFNGHQHSNNKPQNSWAKTSNIHLQNHIQDQDEHLEFLEKSIQELMHNGNSIGSIVDNQNSLLEKVNNGVETLREDMNMVSRKAERQANRSMWKLRRANVIRSVIIQQVPSGKYLMVEPQYGNKLSLQSHFHSEMSLFEIHERYGSKMVGFKNVCSKTYMGQSFFGAIVCNSTKYGRNEEWELDDDSMKGTKLLCASANGGNGGWLQLEEGSSCKFAVLGCDVVDKQKATLWNIVAMEP